MTHSRNGKIGLAAVAAVALAAAGAALAANRIHHRSASSSAGGGAIVPSSLADYANGTGTAPRTDGMRRHGGDDLAAAAAYLGISESDLATQLRSGKTLAQIASATSGKTTAGLIDALVAHEQTELAQAVKDGHLTQARADTITADLKTRITALVNGQMPAHGPGFGHGPGDGDGDGPPGAGTPDGGSAAPSTHI